MKPVVQKTPLFRNRIMFSYINLLDIYTVRVWIEIIK
jgi:hypothetical protein